MAHKGAGLVSKRFRGALMGVLVGDCFGAPFEGIFVNPASVLDHLQQLVSKSGRLRFTDDTAMTKSTCKSLIRNKGFDARDMAREYSESYFRDSRRGYGGAVRIVFQLLRDTNYLEPYGPARNQFDGSGSFGNGAAMRCNAIALFAHQKNLTETETLNLAENCSRITHAHVYGIHGAILLVVAIRYVLKLEEDSFDENEFLKYLIKTMLKLEDDNDHTYSDKLNSVNYLVSQTAISGSDSTQAEIVSMLGNDVAAQNSVPLAIYSFARGVSKFTDTYGIENEFTRTLHWAISCGGDTDTIASMACGLCGAYVGIDKVPRDYYTRCESYEEMLSLADELVALS